MISNSTFEENTSSFGGAIYNNGNIAEIKNGIFEKNYSENSGGAIYNNGTLKLIDTSF